MSERSDLVERLLDAYGQRRLGNEIMRDAADEIERLRAALSEIEEGGLNPGVPAQIAREALRHE